MIVALGALHIPAEEDPADITHHEVRFRQPVEEETGRGTQRFARSIRRENLQADLVERSFLFERVPQPGPELLRADFVVGSALRELHFEHPRPLAGELVAGEQLVDQFPPGGVAVDSRLLEPLLMAVLFLDRGTPANQVERDPAVQIPLVRPGNLGTPIEIGHRAVNPAGQRGRRGMGRRDIGTGIRPAAARQTDGRPSPNAQ